MAKDIAAKQRFVGIVHNQPDEVSAIRAAIEQEYVPPNERGRPMARRRDQALRPSAVGADCSILYFRPGLAGWFFLVLAGFPRPTAGLHLREA